MLKQWATIDSRVWPGVAKLDRGKGPKQGEKHVQAKPVGKRKQLQPANDAHVNAKTKEKEKEKETKKTKENRSTPMKEANLL